MPDFRYSNTFELQRTEPSEWVITTRHDGAVEVTRHGVPIPVGEALEKLSSDAYRWRLTSERSSKEAVEFHDEIKKLRSEATERQLEYDTILRQQYVDGGSTVLVGMALAGAIAALARTAVTAEECASSRGEKEVRQFGGIVGAVICGLALLIGLISAGPTALGKLSNAPYYAAKEFAALKKD